MEYYVAIKKELNIIVQYEIYIWPLSVFLAQSFI